MPSPAQIELPEPVPLKEMPPPPIPEHVRPEPSAVAVRGQTPQDVTEIAIIAKRTYAIGDNGTAVAAEVQFPLSREDVPHEPLADGSKGTPMQVSELIGYRSGTDVIIRAHARPPRVCRQSSVAVRIGHYSHRAVIFGDRAADQIGSAILFSEPEPFAEMPLRFELAYGGQDDLLRDEELASVKAKLSPNDWRTSAAFLKDYTDRMPGIAYPRNRFGRGYVVLDRPGNVVGMKLPNIEFPDDLLTPERVIVGSMNKWHRQPIPAGFDFLEVAAFPRTAMAGVPPTVFDYDTAAEVTRGQIPRGYCRGSIAHTDLKDVGSVVNLEVSRNAAIGLRFGFLRCGETVVLSGMRHDLSEWAVILPMRPPEFTLNFDNRIIRVHGEMHQILIDVDARRLEIIWVARHPVRRLPLVDQTQDLARQTKIDWRAERS